MSKGLTERDMETLNELVAAYDSLLSHGLDGAAPIDIGGSDCSHHSKTLRKLTDYGLVETRKRGFAWGDQAARRFRGSNVYRPTEAGREANRQWRTRA